MLAVEVLGLTELPLAAFDRFLRERANARLRWLQALPLAGMALATAVLANGTPLSQGAAKLFAGIGGALPRFAAGPDSLGWHLLGFVFLASPANHLVRCFVGKSPDGMLAYSVRTKARAGSTHAESATLRAGRAIGTLERWIMVTLILVGQYGLIGLVLTAKSIARFKKIEQDPEFAEYYLLGTLYSTLIALLCGMVLIHV